MGRRHFKPEQIITCCGRLKSSSQAAKRRAASLAVTAIGASPRYSVIKAGTSTTSVWSASGVARGSKYRRNNRNGVACG